MLNSQDYRNELSIRQRKLMEDALKYQNQDLIRQKELEEEELERKRK